MKIIAKVGRGKNSGTVLYPHLYEDGSYVVSKTRFIRDYIHVSNLHEVATYVANGYKVRMSNPQAGVAAASLISARVEEEQ